MTLVMWWAFRKDHFLMPRPIFAGPKMPRPIFARPIWEDFGRILGSGPLDLVPGPVSYRTAQPKFLPKSSPIGRAKMGRGIFGPAKMGRGNKKKNNPKQNTCLN